ncbi:hypothetical protein KY290_033616 [Solanum tuberosum]|uniref:Integrase core domain containing protein n=1 Tax=Solanum tuberosum TaxID=4113 RepID=A0ABQ7U280_SOLTU|nr:hypothetical protein KY290_033616 [Solanum tuberosum]
MEVGGDTQAPVGEITLASLLEALNNVTGDIAWMDGRIATWARTHSLSYSHTQNPPPNLAPNICVIGQEAPPNQSHPYQTPSNQNIPYQRPQPQPNLANEVRNEEDQGGYEGEGEEDPWNELPRNRPRGQLLQGGPRGRLGSMPFERKQHGNHPQGGDQWDVNVNQEVGQEAREGHVNRYQRGYYHSDQGGHGGWDVGINSIKMTLPTFEGECNPDAYFECDQIF